MFRKRRVRTSTTATVSNTAPLTGKAFGVADGSIVFSPAIDSILTDLKALGITWIRADIDWEYVQPTETTFRWSAYDKFVQKANQYGIKVLFIIDYSAPWATVGCQDDAMCYPDTAKFAAFAQAVAARYIPQGVQAYEIWNEPNLSIFWKPQPDAERYTELLKAAYTAIKSVGGTSIVLNGGLSQIASYDVSDDIATVYFLERMYQAGAKQYFDALSFHPYSYPTSPLDPQEWNGWFMLEDATPSIRSIMADHGDSGKKIWLTEFGAPTNGPGAAATCGNLDYGADHVDQCLQAKIIEQGIVIANAKSYIDKTFIYSYKDSGTATNTRENFFGLLNYNGIPKQSYGKVKTLLGP